MIKIYGSKRSTAFRCYWLLEELALPYETVLVDFAKGENKSSEYLKLNPNGKVPTMVDGDFVLWESLAINYYLMEKQQAVELVGNTAQEHAEVNKWNIWGVTHLNASFEPLVLQVYRKTPDSEAIKAAMEVEIPRYLSVLENHLVDKEYVALGKFTLADITLMSSMQSANFVKYDLSNYPNVMAWMARLSEREAFKKLLA
ncbi:MAG: hypothetical protein A2563_01040 [Candidatus Magasanikbacteria bacterium RIFOXYD1_FULL_40_23]|uniref:Glutathione S-transferase n=1 Tax=Candidatus Magasanikbacteria bacterium RIFOXYD1_FULL_40_23 TaxID=1798705 RepID=A0A1F6P890_9BACT|nr:MAG: hypothetical protein A2563_01040 [Candidatus Magasanikbacteria bacterium RIFOXYD1_FULL_40_23]